MNELARTMGAAVVPASDEPGTDVALCVEPEGLLVCGDPSAVAKYVTELRELVSDAIETADVSPVVAAHAGAIAAAGVAMSSHAGEFVRLSSKTVEALKTARALPVGNGFFRGTLVDSAGKFSHQVQWQKVSMAPGRMASVQLLAVQVALASAIASVEKSVARVEGKVERVLTLAEASRAGDVRGHYVVLSRLTAQLDERQILTNTDWESVASLGPKLVVTIERLREHAKRTLGGFDSTKPVHERADYLEKCARRQPTRRDSPSSGCQRAVAIPVAASADRTSSGDRSRSPSDRARRRPPTPRRTTPTRTACSYTTRASICPNSPAWTGSTASGGAPPIISRTTSSSSATTSMGSPRRAVDRSPSGWRSRNLLSPTPSQKWVAEPCR